jgi:hypothetical protein
MTPDMMQYLRSTDLYSLVRMLRAGTTQAILVVEGPSDSLTLTPHINKAETRIIPGYGRTSVEDAIRKAEQDQIPKVVGLADSDIDHLIPQVKTFTSANLVRTEHYDLEADIFYSDTVIDRLIMSLVHHDQIDAVLSARKLDNLSDTVTRFAQTVGHLRVESRKKGTELSLRELPLKGFIRAEKEPFDYAALAAMIKQKSKKTTLTVSQIKRRLAALSNIKRLSRRVCCGHDLLNILVGLLTRWWSAKLTYEGLCWSFRAALSVEDLKKLKIYADLDTWGKLNSREIWAVEPVQRISIT